MIFHKISSRLITSLVFILFFLFAQTLFSSDSTRELSEMVRSKVNNYYFGNNFQIISTENGRIEINGKVKTLYDKLNIFDIISQIPGVIEITDNLVVDSSTLPDKLIETNITSEIKVVKSILEPDRIQVHVDNGEVILTGEVSFYREKLLAETIASWQEGVKGITNQIKILPLKKAVSDENLKLEFQEILRNKFSLNNKVAFNVQDGVVTLSGKAYSLWDKQQIEKEFYKVLGVKKVINNLKVKELQS